MTVSQELLHQLNNVYEVCHATQSFLANVIANGEPSDDDIQLYHKAKDFVDFCNKKTVKTKSKKVRKPPKK